MGQTKNTFTLIGLSERLTNFRKSLNLSRKDFAAKIGVSPSGYANYELCNREMPLSTAATICQVFNLDMNWLVYGSTPLASSSSQELIDIAVQNIARFENNNAMKFPAESEAKAIGFLLKSMSSEGIYSDEKIQSILELMK